jgi:hypothetical protein
MLQAAAIALYGENWSASRFAEDLGVSDRSFRRWCAGTADIPKGVWLDIENLIQERLKAIKEYRDRIGDLNGS